jgi:hypothetical protein
MDIQQEVKFLPFFTRIFVLMIIGFTIALSAYAQSKNRLQPGKLYSAGQTIYAPRYGFMSVVPENWKGTLPREMEIFLLLPDTISIGGEIYTFGNDHTNLENIEENWKKGVSLSETIAIKATNITIRNDMISSEIVPEGNSVNTGNKGFAAARCGPFGACVTCLALGPVQCYADMRAAVESFMTKALFTAPSDISIYADFNWKEFLSDKMLITLAGMERSEVGHKENIFHLCRDGSFTGQIKKSGTMKEFNSNYKGKQSGTWSTESIGDNGVLKLTFKKLPAVEIPLTIKNDQIFVNGERYFAGDSGKCGNKK